MESQQRAIMGQFSLCCSFCNTMYMQFDKLQLLLAVSPVKWGFQKQVLLSSANCWAYFSLKMGCPHVNLLGNEDILQCIIKLLFFLFHSLLTLAH